MGVGWIQTNQKNEPLTFSASVENWPSSTKTEVLAILSVPPVTPLRKKYGKHFVRTVTPSNTNIIEDLINNYLHITIYNIQQMVSIPTESIETILHEEISVRKVCAKWVPYALTNENKQKQFKVSKQLFGYLENGFRNIITGDETWLHFFTVSSKDANEVWLSKVESWPQIIRIAQNRKKQIFCIFFSADGVVASIVVEKGHTVTSNY
ncbi:481_t:CDS:2 [Entrophospora sp. SA101]|nr:481_t:CDS:2 [Entrophospora sp. SA101]